MHLARTVIARGNVCRRFTAQLRKPHQVPNVIFHPQEVNAHAEIGTLHSFGEPSMPVYHQRSQTRFRRHDRASAFTKPRPPTKKQRKKHNRKLKQLEREASKHNPPGFRAGPRRQWAREQWQHLLDKGKESSEVSDPATKAPSELYGFGDALLDDLMGNTSYLTSQPTPEPEYVGHKHAKFVKKLSRELENYRDGKKQRQNEMSMLEQSPPSLPSDAKISNVLRAYRDLNGTKSKPIGISRALEHLLKDLRIPISAFGEFTFTTLLTCCRTPKEARRIFKLMNEHQHPISSYSWSILVDVHARGADFQGCYSCMQEMIANDVPPSQAAYTSLFAACYKVCNDGRISHAIRAKAGKLGWEMWQEMIITGIEPDAMAYGAIIRLCASRGRPERAINLLQDMDRFGVKPTTLCFASALRAVAKSHSTAIRFENGSSRKQLRREWIAAHHGKMARAITIMAENAEVHMDDGFVSALVLCAAAAGDSATAKAVYLASKVRGIDHLRTIGPESHLRRLRGEKRPEFTSSALAERSGIEADSGENALECSVLNVDAATESKGLLGSGQGSELVRVSHDSSFPVEKLSYGEREYGRDSRILSALVHACSTAAGDNNIGTLWAGSQNQGYLCENSLRLITTRWKPKYVDRSIPGVNTTEVGIAALRRYDENEPDTESKPGVRKKFRGLYMDEDSALTIDEIDDKFAKMFEEDSQQDEEASDFEGNDIRNFTGEVKTGQKGSSHKYDETLYFGKTTMRRQSRTSVEAQATLDEVEAGSSLANLNALVSSLRLRIIPNSHTFCTLPGEAASMFHFLKHMPKIVNFSRSLLLPGSTYGDIDCYLCLLCWKYIVCFLPVQSCSHLFLSVSKEQIEVDADANAEEKSRSSTASLGNPQVRPNEAADRSSILYFEGGMDTLEPTVHPSSHENIPPGSSESCIIGDSATTVKDPAQEGKWRPPGTEAAASVQSTTTELSSAETEFSVEEFSKGLAPAEQSEKYVAQMRILCRQQDVEDDVGLDEIVGEDPVKWLKHGEKILKREMSKKGRRNVLLARNRLL